ncbi:N-acetyl-alpha-D-glucosaminyl L-malate synthase BshA [Paenibacillus albiflavus]|uniref:N-acetyl-alpha-D-glucosaminyl L-malate synthase BshA n=1 Tax=Paenibacillus albiflavus TaxID=2545760 RepID=A0A4R4ELN5_9BACL|nr:N-acetyl-alpha-D-glucosaminyl L-malate synthase BshA [Paenibacillus albiflavus]TCZ81186.1 N-acetyl-alpha-D-glucosaminyl L-malate synthase BshA [Paenibacillus albiflavus]
MSDFLKIGITCYPTLGGSGVVATELGMLLAEKGHEVHFITHGMPFRLGRFVKNIFYHEVEVPDYHVFRYPPYDLALASKLAQVAELKDLDLLHVHYAIPHAVCAILAKQMVGSKLKVVTTLHGTDITVLAQDQSISNMIQYAINDSDAVTAVSQDLIRETRETLDIKRDIDLIYNFVDKRIYYPHDVSELRKEFAEPHEKILIHISNFRPVKRVLDVVETFNLVNQQVPSKLMFVGEGPELSKVHQRVNELGLNDRVIFCGKQDDVAKVISLADMMLLPSEKESFGLVALEAMSCGVPTVGSNAGGIPELIVHGQTGYLADIGDVKAMAAYAVKALTDPKLYAEMKAACLFRAHHTFCNDYMTYKYEEIYYRVTGKEMPACIKQHVLEKCPKDVSDQLKS